MSTGEGKSLCESSEDVSCNTVDSDEHPFVTSASVISIITSREVSENDVSKVSEGELCASKEAECESGVFVGVEGELGVSVEVGCEFGTSIEGDGASDSIVRFEGELAISVGANREMVFSSAVKDEMVISVDVKCEFDGTVDDNGKFGDFFETTFKFGVSVYFKSEVCVSTEVKGVLGALVGDKGECCANLDGELGVSLRDGGELSVSLET